MIKLKNLTYKIKENIILNNINLKINKGDFIAVLGLNGSGKSQLAMLIAGFIENYQGEFFYEDKLITPKDFVGKKIGVIFQEPDDQFFASIVKNDIAFGLENKSIKHDDMEKIIDDNLEKINMINFKDRNINLLSGGEKQKIATAAILALDFDVLIFDEATSMLDQKSASNLIKIIKQLSNEGKTIILITHNIEEITDTNRTLILKKGELLEDLETKNLTKAILNKYELI